MKDSELIQLAMQGEVVGNGVMQVAALVGELRKRPKAIVIDMQDETTDDLFGVRGGPLVLRPAKPVAIIIEGHGNRWKFEQAITTETPTVVCGVEYASHAGDASETIIITQLETKGGGQPISSPAS